MQVGEVVLTSNEVKKRSEKMKVGRVVVQMKMFPGFTEGDNMLDALVNLSELTEALKEEGQPLDFLITTTRLWFQMVPVPNDCKSQLLAGKEASQMLIWFSKTCQVTKYILNIYQNKRNFAFILI